MTESDALVVCARPAGLYGARHAGVHRIIVDPLPAPAGQIATLYPDNPIGDVASSGWRRLTTTQRTSPPQATGWRRPC